MYDLCACILNLPGICKSYSEVIRPTAAPAQNTARIQHGATASHIATDPLYDAVFVYDPAFRVQIVRIFAPVLHAGVAEARAFFYKNLHTPGVQCALTIFWCAASLDVVSLRTFVYHHQCMLKLAHRGGVHTEVRL